MTSQNFGIRYYQIDCKNLQMKKIYGKMKNQKKSQKTLMKIGSQRKMGFDIQNALESMKKMYLE